MKIKAIETKHNGYRFRSRLEARWAVFFEEMRVPYQYEAHGFDIDGSYYLPDFYLDPLHIFFEVKGEWPSEVDWRKIRGLSTEHPVLVAVGECSQDGELYYVAGGQEYGYVCFTPCEECETLAIRITGKPVQHIVCAACRTTKDYTHPTPKIVGLSFQMFHAFDTAKQKRFGKIA